MHHKYLLLFLMSSVLSIFAMEPDSSIFGHKNYTEYRPGTGIIILTASHGGTLRPNDIPGRKAGCWGPNGTCIWRHSCGLPDRRKCRAATSMDLYSLDLAEIAREELFNLTGHRPHLIINRLHRSKMDANRDIEEAAQGNGDSEKAWHDFHGFIRRAKATIDTEGILFDFHGQTHPEGFVELGYLLKGPSLDSGEFHANMTSIRRLSDSLPVHFKTLIQGNRSLGRYVKDEGYRTVPSPANPGPGGTKYFSGGYITRIHGSFHGGKVDAIQIESPKYLRNSEKGPAYARALARAINNFMLQNYIMSSNRKPTTSTGGCVSTQGAGTKNCGTNTAGEVLRYRKTSLLIPAFVGLLCVHVRNK